MAIYHVDHRFGCARSLFRLVCIWGVGDQSTLFIKMVLVIMGLLL